MADFLIEVVFAFIEVVLRAGVPALFRRNLTAKLNVIRWIAILSPCMLVICWWAARRLDQVNQQETLIELILGISGGVFIVTFFICTGWCGVAVRKEAAQKVAVQKSERNGT